MMYIYMYMYYMYMMRMYEGVFMEQKYRILCIR